MKWRKQHKLIGIFACFLMVLFCFSGIALNHRQLLYSTTVSRKFMPSSYKFHNWNSGLMRGTIKCGDSIFIYGTNGIWLTDSLGKKIKDSNAGIPTGEHRKMRGLIIYSDTLLVAASQTSIFRKGLNSDKWECSSLPLSKDERLTDITMKGDTIIALGRSFLYLSSDGGNNFEKIQLKKPSNYIIKPSLFRTVWLLHSGELFGNVGKAIVDVIAIILLILSITGIFIFILKNINFSRGCRFEKVSHRALKPTMHWHDKIGRWTILMTMFLIFTGWCLRPPAMIPLAIYKTAPLPYSYLDNPNSWHDRLRMIRYDDFLNAWLISTSEGFFCLEDITAPPIFVSNAPMVSVMGLNVWEKNGPDEWICGSFSGLYIWNTSTGEIKDWYTGESAQIGERMPISTHSISGFSSDFATGSFPVLYDKGTDAIIQPQNMSCLPMPLWDFSLEVHSGRIFIGSIATYVFIFFIGIIFFWVLLSGYKIPFKGK